MAANEPPHTTRAAVGCHKARVGAPSSNCARSTAAMAAGTPTMVASSMREGRRLLMVERCPSRAARSGCQRSGHSDDAAKFRLVAPVVHARSDLLHERQIVFGIDGHADI